MLKRFSLVVLILLLSFHLKASSDVGMTQLKNIESFSSLSITYGWYHEVKSNKWITKENQIKGIDSFENYYILSFYNQDKSHKYIAIIKKQKSKSNFIYDTYILNYQDYVDQIGLWEEHSLLKFPILRHQQVIIKKNEFVSNESLGLTNLSDLLTTPRNYFIFQYKFNSDSTVKFLFYVESCSSEDCSIAGLSLKKEYSELSNSVGKEKLYDMFFYKTTLKYFIDFIDSPLNK